jgi:hypothetical protein
VGVLADRLHSHDVPDLIDGSDHGVIDPAFDYAFHQAAIDFQVVRRQHLQVAEAGSAAAEIVDGQREASFLQLMKKLRGMLQVVQHSHFRDLEADLLGNERRPSKRVAKKTR